MAYALLMLTPLLIVLVGAAVATPPVSLEPLPLRDGECSMGDASPWVTSGDVRFETAPSSDVDRSIEWFDGAVAVIGKGSMAQQLEDANGESMRATPGAKYLVGFGFGGEGTLRVSLRGAEDVVLVRSEAITPPTNGIARAFVELTIPEGTAAHQPLTLAFTAAGGQLLIDKVSIALVGTDEVGFVSLFNGTNLDGWVGVLSGYGVEDGVIRTYPKRAGGNIYTADEYDNFVFRFRFNVEPGSNNGIAIRAPLGGDAAYQGMEVQLLENSHKKYAGLKDWQFHGSIYGIAAAERGYQRPAGEWNDQEIRVDGRRVSVTLNGYVITDVDLDKAMANGTLSGREHPGALRTGGHLGFCGHGDLVQFKDLRILPLDSTK